MVILMVYHQYLWHKLMWCHVDTNGIILDTDDMLLILMVSHWYWWYHADTDGIDSIIDDLSIVISGTDWIMFCIDQFKFLESILLSCMFAVSNFDLHVKNYENGHKSNISMTHSLLSLFLHSKSDFRSKYYQDKKSLMYLVWSWSANIWRSFLIIFADEKNLPPLVKGNIGGSMSEKNEILLYGFLAVGSDIANPLLLQL